MYLFTIYYLISQPTYKCQSLSVSPFPIVQNKRDRGLVFKDFTSKSEEETIGIIITKAARPGENCGGK